MFIAYYKSSAFDNLFFIEERKMGRPFFFIGGGLYLQGASIGTECTLHRLYL
jgi:hypothetical protein